MIVTKNLAVRSQRQGCMVALKSDGGYVYRRWRRKNVKSCKVVRCVAALAEKRDAAIPRKGSNVNMSLANSRDANEYIGPHSLSLTPTSSLGSRQSLFSSIAMGYRLTESKTNPLLQWDDNESNLMQETERLQAAALMWINSLKLHSEDVDESDCKSMSQEAVAHSYGHLPIVTNDIAFEKYLSYEEGAGINPVTTAIRAASEHLETPIILYKMNELTSNDNVEAPLFSKVFSAGEEFLHRDNTTNKNLSACIHLVYDDMEMTYKLLFPTPDAN